MSINEELKSVGLQQRDGIIVYLDNISNQYRLRKYGDIVYFSKKMKYCVIYIDNNDAEKIKDEIANLDLDFVKMVEDSATDKIDLDSAYIEEQIQDLAQKAEAELAERQEKEDLYN